MSDHVICIYRAVLKSKLGVSTEAISDSGATIKIHARDGGFCLVLWSHKLWEWC